MMIVILFILGATESLKDTISYASVYFSAMFR